MLRNYIKRRSSDIFLGMGEHDILIEPSKIKFVNEPRRTQTSSANPPAGNPRDDAARDHTHRHHRQCAACGD